VKRDSTAGLGSLLGADALEVTLTRSDAVDELDPLFITAVGLLAAGQGVEREYMRE
jgi:hypothetical protein